MREKIGRSISGWRSYGAWAYAPGGAEDTYLLDDAPRFLANADARDGAVPASESLKRFCELLRLGKDGTEASRACKPDDGDNQMNHVSMAVEKGAKTAVVWLLFTLPLSLLEGGVLSQRSRARRRCAAKRTLHGEDRSEILDKRERGGPKWTAKMAQSLTASDKGMRTSRIQAWYQNPKKHLILAQFSNSPWTGRLRRTLQNFTV